MRAAWAQGLRQAAGQAGRQALGRLKTVPGLLRQALKAEQVVLTLLAVGLGVLGGYVALGFRLLASAVQYFVFGAGGEHLASAVTALPWWHTLLAPAAGGLVIGLFMHFAMPGQRARGIANVMEASAIHGAVMPLKPGLLSALVSASSIGVGASVGREGAIVHLCATLASWIGQAFRLPAAHFHTMLGCGVAAAVAASFNAPIAGVFFALEVVVGHYALNAFAPVVLASVIGTMISRVHFGDFPAFSVPHYAVATFWEFPAFVMLGVVSAIAAIAFMWTMFVAEDAANRVPMPNWARPAVGGLLLGAAALLFPQILGVGYEATDGALNAELPLWMMLGLIVVKTVGTAVSLASRFGGGVFSPSLFVGSMVGGAFGTIALWLFPEAGSNSGLYAIVGMAAVAAAVLGAPISTILIVFELTGDFKVTIGVMSGAAVACLVTQALLGHSIFTWQLERRGVKLAGGRARQLLQAQKVGDVMDSRFQIVPETMKLNDLKHLLHMLPEGAEMFVVGAGNRLVGTVSLADIKDVAFDPLVNEDGIDAMQVCRLYPAVLESGDSLETALKIMEEAREEQLPVVETREGGVVAGLLRYRTVLGAYNDALLQAEAEAHGRKAA
ncbi:MAG TPA: chloride channel protein [Alphaproteobacteria bacterium]|nr:chloride channel protein [Alphaproteobacteria bacterium]